jgi:hypothetical protein
LSFRYFSARLRHTVYSGRLNWTLQDSRHTFRGTRGERVQEVRRGGLDVRARWMKSLPLPTARTIRRDDCTSATASQRRILRHGHLCRAHSLSLIL